MEEATRVLGWRQRLAPLLALLDAKYFPLLFAVAPQSYAVYLWLWRESDRTDAAFWFAVAGAIGYEFIYVGAIAWAEHGEATRWTWVTAGVALIFSIAVAVYVYIDQGYWSALHAGFPLVAFCYTITMHVSGARAARIAHDGAELAHARTELHTQRQTVAQLQAEAARLADDLAHAAPLAAQTSEEAAQLRDRLARTEQEAAQHEQETARWQADVARAQQTAVQQDRELARLRAEVAQRDEEAARLLHAGDIDVLAIAQRLVDAGVAWRDIGTLLHTPQSTLRNRLKARSNGHLVEATV